MRQRHVHRAEDGPQGCEPLVDVAADQELQAARRWSSRASATVACARLRGRRQQLRPLDPRSPARQPQRATKDTPRLIALVEFEHPAIKSAAALEGEGSAAWSLRRQSSRQTRSGRPAPRKCNPSTSGSAWSEASGVQRAEMMGAATSAQAGRRPSRGSGRGRSRPRRFRPRLCFEISRPANECSGTRAPVASPAHWASSTSRKGRPKSR